MKRIGWIDCAKFVAVIAVVVDHCYGLMYISPFIAYASYFSVSLFILLSGISTWTAFERGKDTSFLYQFSKVKRLLVLYAVAVLVVLCIEQKKFDMKIYLRSLVEFNIQGPYYYLVFFIQLLMIAPILVTWCRNVNNRKHKWIIHAGALGAFGWFAYISINYTYILPVHGGGQFLGGGTYVILYYMGMLLASNGVFEQSINKRVLIAVICCGTSIVWILLMAEEILPFDRWMSPYWGAGFNPPSINLMIYSLLVLFVCYSVFSLLCKVQNKLVRRIVFIVSFFGKNTLYIWLYHLIVKSFFLKQFPDLFYQNLIFKAVIFCAIVAIPAIVKQVIYMFGEFCYDHLVCREDEYKKL